MRGSCLILTLAFAEGLAAGCAFRTSRPLGWDALGEAYIVGYAGRLFKVVPAA
jgi:hypothetical protein